MKMKVKRRRCLRGFCLVNAGEALNVGKEVFVVFLVVHVSDRHDGDFVLRNILRRKMGKITKIALLLIKVSHLIRLDLRAKFESFLLEGDVVEDGVGGFLVMLQKFADLL